MGAGGVGVPTARKEGAAQREEKREAGHRGRVGQASTPRMWLGETGKEQAGGGGKTHAGSRRVDAGSGRDSSQAALCCDVRARPCPGLCCPAMCWSVLWGRAAPAPCGMHCMRHASGLAPPLPASIARPLPCTQPPPSIELNPCSLMSAPRHPFAAVRFWLLQARHAGQRGKVQGRHAWVHGARCVVISCSVGCCFPVVLVMRACTHRDGPRNSDDVAVEQLLLKKLLLKRNCCFPICPALPAPPLWRSSRLCGGTTAPAHLPCPALSCPSCLPSTPLPRCRGHPECAGVRRQDGGHLVGG